MDFGLEHSGGLENVSEQMGFKPEADMEQIMQNVEMMNQQSLGSESVVDQAIQNLEDLSGMNGLEGILEAGGRAVVEMATMGGVVREVITTIVEAVEDIFHPEEASLKENLESAAKEWHVQEQDNTCAVACQEFIISEYTGIDVSESTLTMVAESNGWFDESGTPMSEIGNLLEVYGIDTEVRYDGDYAALKEAVQDGNRVIVGVNNVAMNTDWCDGMPVLSANHAIEVLAIDDSDPENVKVYINDPGVEDGCAKEVTLENFLDAWSTSGGYMLTALRN